MNDARDPKWRRDFPVTSEGEEEVTRREFVNYMVLASCAFAGANLGIAVWSQLRRINHGAPRPLLPAAELPPGTAHLFRYPTEADPAILVRLAGGELRAYSQKCTHLGCVVTWQPRQDQLRCPCHDGSFDARAGTVLAGPPQLPLDRIDVELRADGLIWARGA